MVFVRTQRDASVHAFLIISYALVARTGRPPLGPLHATPSPQGIACPIIPINRMVFVGVLHATPLPQGIACPIIPINRMVFVGALHATPLRLRRLISPEWSSYGRNVMRPYTPS